MSTAVPSTTTAEQDMLEMLRINVRHWRTTSGLSFRYMPLSLWGEVISAAQMLGAHRVAAAVGVNIEDLKRRLAARESKFSTPKVIEPSTEFVELPGVALPVPAPRTRVTNDEAVIEVVATDGTTLTVRVPVAHLNIAALVHEFRGRA